MRPGEMPVCTAPPMLRPWKGRWGASTHSAPTLKGPFTQPPSTGTSLPLSSTSSLLSSHASGSLTRAFCVQNTVRAPGPANSASGVKIFLSGVARILLPPARYPRRTVLGADTRTAPNTATSLQLSSPLLSPLLSCLRIPYARLPRRACPVSYTHLTLPTILRV